MLTPAAPSMGTAALTEVALGRTSQQPSDRRQIQTLRGSASQTRRGLDQPDALAGRTVLEPERRPDDPMDGAPEPGREVAYSADVSAA